MTKAEKNNLLNEIEKQQQESSNKHVLSNK